MIVPAILCVANATGALLFRLAVGCYDFTVGMRPGNGDRMTVRRLVANISAADPDRARAFYEKLLDLKVVMDHGWILTFAAEASAAPQLSVASEGGSGTQVPDLSIEVDDVDEIYKRGEIS